MKRRRRVIMMVFGAGALRATDALACGGEVLVEFLIGLMVFHALLLTVIFIARRETLARRIKFAVFYVLSTVAIWILSPQVSQLSVRSQIILVFTLPIVLMIVLRYFLTHSRNHRDAVVAPRA